MKKKLFVGLLALSSIGMAIGSIAYSFRSGSHDGSSVITTPVVETPKRVIFNDISYANKITDIPYNNEISYSLYSEVNFDKVLKSLPRYDELLLCMNYTSSYSKSIDIDNSPFVNGYYFSQFNFGYNYFGHYFYLDAFGEIDSSTIIVNLLKWDTSHYYAYFVNDESYSYYLGLFLPSGNTKVSQKYSYNQFDNNQLYVWRAFAWFFTNATIRHYSFEMNNNFVELLNGYLNKNTNVTDNSFFFYDTETPEIINVFNTSGVAIIPLFYGSFYFENQFYSQLDVNVASVYFSPSSPDLSEVRKYYLSYNDIAPIVSTDSAFQNYYYIDSVVLRSGDTSQVKYLYRRPTNIQVYQNVYMYQSGWQSTNSRFVNVEHLSTMNIISAFSFSTLSQLESITLLGTLNYVPIIYQPTDITGTTTDSVFDWLIRAFTGMMPLLNFMILPNISLGVILLTPLLVGIILFIVRLFKR